MVTNATGNRVTEMFAYIAVDDDGDEGICAFYSPAMGGMLPMVGADMARMQSLRPMAEILARVQPAGHAIYLIRFAGPPQVIEVFPPGPQTAAPEPPDRGDAG